MNPCKEFFLEREFITSNKENNDLIFLTKVGNREGYEKIVLNIYFN